MDLISENASYFLSFVQVNLHFLGFFPLLPGACTIHKASDNKSIFKN